MAEVPEASAEQLDVVQQPADTAMLVTAGPGTGKTFCLIRRLEFLVDEEELEPDEVLVLSFSRAAVREIKNRLAAHGAVARHVTVQTFDSFATQQIEGDSEVQALSFDRRIGRAIEVLRADDTDSILPDIRHLVVDEVQDLVGIRAELVKTLLDRTDGGFTLLGDPAQGIYGFQLEGAEERMRGSAALYQWVRERFAGDLVERTLSKNFRACADVQLAPGHGRALQYVDADYSAIQRDLRTRLMSQPALGSLQEAIPLLTAGGAPTAILTSTNGQALLISRELYRHQVPHRLQRSAQELVLPAWLGELFLAKRNERRATRDDLEFVLAEYETDLDEAWPLLKRMEGSSRGSSVNLRQVRDRLRIGNVPDELTRQSPAELIVSTVHRAKGLEFDHVVVVDPGESGKELVAQAESARLLYVAMTRPREAMSFIDPVDKLATGRITKQGERWIEAGPKNRRYGVEFRAGDVDHERPPGDGPDEAQAAQRYLSRELRPGAPVTLRAIGQGGVGKPPRYSIEHQGVCIGSTADNFEWALRVTNPGRNREKWPVFVERLHVESVETVCGSEARGTNYGLGWSGVWLRPRIVGLGRLVWGK